MEWKNAGWFVTEHPEPEGEEVFEVERTADVIKTPGGWLVRVKAVSQHGSVAVCAVEMPDPEHLMQFGDDDDWLELPSNLHDHDTHSVETLEEFLRTPLGWLVRTILVSDAGGSVAVSLVHIMDPNHEMNLQPVPEDHMEVKVE